MRSAAVTSVLTLGAQLMAVAVQLVFAGLFGTSPDTDAYFAALTLPAFVAAVVSATIPVVVVPIVVARRARAGGQDAAAVADATANLTLLVVGVLVAGAVVFADPILRAYAPGLPPAGHALAVRLAAILWPSAATSSVVALLTALWQADRRFGWPAAVPLVGTASGLLLLVLMVPALGILGAALAWTLSVLVEVALLVPLIARRWRPRLSLSHPGVREAALAVWPLILANVFIQASEVWERYLASFLPVGQLSQLTYASRIVLSVSILLSAGPAAVMLPRLAELAGDRLRLSNAIEKGLHSMWLVVAPAAALLIVLAEPGVTLVFQRGAFTSDDTRAVALLLRVYVLALIPGVLAVVTARALYAIRATRVVAMVGAIEGLAYLGYTAWLSSILGAVGIALGFAIFAWLSLAWQVAYLHRVARSPSLRSLCTFAFVGVAAALAGLTASAVSIVLSTHFAATAMGVTVGSAVYVAVLLAGRARGAPSFGPLG